MLVSVLVVCAVGAVSGALGAGTAGTAGTDRHQRSPTERFLNIDTDRTINKINNELPDDLANIVWNLVLGPGHQSHQRNQLEIEAVEIPLSLDVVVTNTNTGHQGVTNANTGHQGVTNANTGHQGVTNANTGHQGAGYLQQRGDLEIETINVPSSLDFFVTDDNSNQRQGRPDVFEGYGTSFANEGPIPFSDGLHLFDTSYQMILSYRRQRSPAPELPAIIPHFQLPNRIEDRQQIPFAPQIPQNTPIPPRPDFNRSLRQRVDLTATNSDYTEAYDIQWHAPSGTAHTVVEDGTTVFYRTLLADGRVQHLEVRVDGNAVRRCTLSPFMQASRADRSFPGLPEMDQFVFTGYTSAEGRPVVERWQRLVVGGPGEGGAAFGESLKFTHEMLVARENGEAVPLRYTVVTDSSVLGPGSDTYTHRYTLLPPPITPVLPDLSKLCDVSDEFKYDRRDTQKDVISQIVSQFDPIREFMDAGRDTKYDSIFGKYKQQFQRKYVDTAEEALRKTLLIKSSRFIAAGNRLGSSFQMEANFLADRLNDELNQLYGVEALPENAKESGWIPFPYSKNDVKEISNKLDEEFDWRQLGGVSPVRFQDTTCASCWAFAVAGSTEGALFKKTSKLVPLSVQCLVDCGKPYGAHGCDGTWPAFGYDYVQARGLPAWDDYTPYQAKVLQCREASVPPVTHISGHVNVTTNNEAALKVAIKNHAPTVVIVDGLAQSFIFYKTGVLKDKRCGANKTPTKGGGIKGLNHAVLAVGWGNKDGPHFILKNTWSAKWGEAGYIRMDPDSCGVLERPSYSLIEEPNIDRQNLRAAARANQA